MMKFIDKYWGAWAALGLLVLITLFGWLGGINDDVPGKSFAGFFDKAAFLIGQGNVAVLLCVLLTGLLVFLTVRGWARSEKKPNPPGFQSPPWVAVLAVIWPTSGASVFVAAPAYRVEIVVAWLVLAFVLLPDWRLTITRREPKTPSS